jgi:hypothetical protein
MMDLRKATIEDISMELSRRNQPFFLILAKPDNPEAQFYCHTIPPKMAIHLLEDGGKVMKSIVNDGIIPPNCKIVKNVIRNGKIVDQVEVTEIGDMFDPWKPKNEVGEFNPWEEAKKRDDDEEVCAKPETNDDVVELPPEDGFDPWKNKDEI